jgi:hypothetical protein
VLLCSGVSDPDPYHFGHFGIRIQIKNKSRIRIRIKVEIQRPRRLKMELQKATDANNAGVKAQNGAVEGM